MYLILFKNFDFEIFSTIARTRILVHIFSTLFRCDDNYKEDSLLKVDDEIQVLARVNHCKTHVLNFPSNRSKNGEGVVVHGHYPTLDDIRKALCLVLGLTRSSYLYFLSTQGRHPLDNNSSCCSYAVP